MSDPRSSPVAERYTTRATRAPVTEVPDRSCGAYGQRVQDHPRGPGGVSGAIGGGLAPARGAHLPQLSVTNPSRSTRALLSDTSFTTWVPAVPKVVCQAISWFFVAPFRSTVATLAPST